MLHVLNGDAAGAVFGRAALAGDVMVWRDILVEGPVSTGDDAVPIVETRADFLAERLAIDRDDYLRNAREQAAALETARDHDEVVLWFEQDLFCAVNLWRLLDWFGRHAPAARLSLIYPSRDDVNGLGNAEPARLAALFAERTPVTRETLARGGRAWAAYASPDPLDSAPLVDAEDDTLPFVRGAFRCHLGRFPSVTNGLNEVETATLSLLRRAPMRFGALFTAVGTHPRVRRHGMGDVQFAGTVRGLIPLVELVGSDVTHADVEITQLGRDVVAGETDWLGVRPIDAWLGGVRLTEGRPLWRWDGARGRLVPAGH